MSQSQCEAKGCCWNPVALEESEGEEGPALKGTPWCFHPNSQVEGYKVLSAQETSNGYTFALGVIGSPIPSLGEDVTPLRVNVSVVSDASLRVTVFDPARQRWEVPHDLLPRPYFPDSAPAADKAAAAFAFSYTSEPFGFAVTRKSTNEVLFNSTPAQGFNGLVFKDQYLELSTALPTSARLYGIGESTQPSGLALNASDGEPRTIWTHDTPALVPRLNLYGAWPFYVDVREDGSAHGVALVNSNGMDITYNADALTYRVIGGLLDFFLYLGPSPEDVVAQHAAVVGRPMMPPFWSLGFHNCRWGYSSVAEVEEVVANYSAAGIPLDTEWFDIDWMSAYEDFEPNATNFPAAGMKQFADSLHANDQRMVVIIDPGIHNRPGYDAYDKGLAAGAFLRDRNNNTFIGKVWPGTVAFPDFLNPATTQYWHGQIAQFHAKVPVDGLWIDMNEASNFCTGECPSEAAGPAREAPATAVGRRRLLRAQERGAEDEESTSSTYPFYGPSFDANNPPFHINNDGVRDALNARAIDVDVSHHGGVLEYDAHNLYGFTESIATHKALAAVRGTRPFLLSRSSFLGSGHWTAHWTGDNSATWNDLYWSVLGMLNSNLQSIPLVGSDICGFNGNTNEELCRRWIQLGAFYPFSRVHNSIGQISQELYRWDSVADSARTVLALRYRLLPYYYTLFAMAHAGPASASASAAALAKVLPGGATVARPLWFRCPSDPTCRGVDKQFMIGAHVLVSPVLEPGASSVQAYLPEGTWYNAFNYAAIAGGRWATLPAPSDAINVHVAGGAVLATQAPGRTALETARQPFELVVTVDPAALTARGGIYWDDGETIGADDTAYTAATFTASFGDASAAAGALKSSPLHNGFQGTPPVARMFVFGVKATPNTVHVNGAALPSSQWTWDASVAMLNVSTPLLSLGTGFAIEWSL